MYEIGKCCKEQGRPSPHLVAPLYGKSDKQFEITVQLIVNMVVDGRLISVPAFVQPHSDQKYLFGVNASPALGLWFTDCKGVQLRKNSPHGDEVAGKDYFMQTCSTPRMAGKFIKARVEPCVCEKETLLEYCGRLAQENPSASFLVPRQDGTVLILMQKFGESAVTLTRVVELGSVIPLQI